MMKTRLLQRFVAFALLLMSITTGCTPENRAPQSIQPDYRRWEQVKVGMSETEVEALLGKPLDRIPDCSNGFTVYGATYGIIRFNPTRFPGSYTFDVNYHCTDHRVVEKNDPFDGMLSLDRKPTVPSLIYPTDGQQFDHYPRNTDFRWTPSSGDYPMTYEVQLNWEPGNGWDGPRAGVIVRKTAEPYLVENWVGKNDGVWRVRAINRFGISSWSKEREFSFSR